MIALSPLNDFRVLFVFQEEIDQKSVIRLTWRKLLEVCERVTDTLHTVQGTYKKKLIKNVKVWVRDRVDVKSPQQDNASYKTIDMRGERGGT